MVFGNLGDTSGTGVCFTRDPATGRTGSYGDYLPNAQGEDVVAGIRNTLSLDDLERLDAVSAAELRQAMRRLETHYRDLCDIEFTIERGKLWMLQTRVGKRTAAAAFRIAVQLVDEDLITLDEALLRVTGAQLAQLMFPQLRRYGRTQPARPAASPPRPARRSAASSSTPRTAVAWAESGEKVILVRRETNPDDLGGMIAAQGILTSRAAARPRTRRSSPAAWERPAVCGADDARRRSRRRGGSLPRAGSPWRRATSSPSTAPPARCSSARCRSSPSPVVRYFEGELDRHARATTWSRACRPPHGPRRRRYDGSRVRANADTPDDARRARRMGAAGHRAVPDRAHVPRRAEAVRRAADPRRGEDDQAAALDALLPVAARGLHPHPARPWTGCR